jgi:hypothetical protein
MTAIHPKPKPVKQAKPKKRKKKTPRQIIIRDLDKLCREIVLRRDEQSVPLVYRESLNAQGAVEYSINHRGVPQWGHIITSAAKYTRWDLRNTHKQDANDNLLHEYYPEIYITWFIDNFGMEEWKDLLDDSRKVWKYSMDDLETLYFELIEIQKKQEADPSYKPYHSQKDIISGAWRNNG